MSVIQPVDEIIEFEGQQVHIVVAPDGTLIDDQAYAQDLYEEGWVAEVREMAKSRCIGKAHGKYRRKFLNEQGQPCWEHADGFTWAVDTNTQWGQRLLAALS